MTKVERLQKNGLKAGIKKSKKEGHVLTKEELLKMKVQVMPSPIRWISGILGLAVMGHGIFVGALSILLILVGLFLLVCGIFGYRKSLSKIIDNMGAVSGEVALRLICEGMAVAVSSIFD